MALKRQVTKSPVLAAALLRSSEVFDSLPLKEHCNEETRDKLSRGLLDKVYGIIGAPNPVAKCREELVSLVIELTGYQVLIIPPEPDADPTRLRGTQGVTGGLKAHLLEISEANKQIKELMHGWTENPTYDDVSDAVLLRYWVCHWYAETISACRITLGDYNPVEGRDWYRPFYHSQCVFAEDMYRKEIGLPPADVGMIESLAYSTFMSSVLRGEKYPDLAWTEHYKDMIERGDLRPPF